MDVDELMELKKAYADMILDTSKEAVGNFMMSERTTHQLEFELKESKDNALQMLTIIKQMMDSKFNETKMISQIQQKKIEELEAQLQEAEDIVKDLREELSSMHAQIERTKPINAVNPDSIPTTNVRNQSNKGHILYSSLFPFWKSNIDDQHLPAIISRRKGRKLYRSDCTHRIHACEGTPCQQTNVTTPDLITETDKESENLHKDPSLSDERKKVQKIASPNGKKRTEMSDEVEESDDVANDSFSSTARSAKRSKMEDSDNSINTDTGLVSVRNGNRRSVEELLHLECENTELPLSSEAPLNAPELKVIETNDVGVPIHAISARVIKYTFQRKMSSRILSMKKKEEEESALLETEKVITTEKSTQEENAKVKSIEKSTQEKSHIENVAKQLIALSGKKWCH